MIKQMFSIFFVMASLLVVAPASASDLKIGVVNAAIVLDKAPQTTEARSNLEQEFSPREKKLVAQQKEIKRLEEKLARDSAVMSETERRKLDRDIQTKKRDWKRANTEFREDVTIRQNELLNQVQEAVMVAIRDIAKTEGYDLILGDGVIFANDKVDITKLVIDRLKK